MRGSLLPARPAAVAGLTPRDRDRFVDFLRAGSILVVVLGHWLMATVVRQDGALRADNALASVRWLQPATWLLQVMPVFFMVSGYTNAVALTRPAASVASYLSRRTSRLTGPALLLVAGWLATAALLTTVGVPAASVRDAASVAAQPLWFLAVYLLLVLVAPAQLRLHRRHPTLLLVALPVLAGGLDAARLLGSAGGLADLNYLLVFAFAQEVGFCYADGWPTRLRPSALLGTAAGALAALTLLTTVGPYPVSMVGVPGDAISNMSPPTVCLLLVTVVQVSVLLAARPSLQRWLHRPRPWTLTVAANSVVLTVFLWHLTAFVLAAAVLAGPAQTVPAAGSSGWWLVKPVWLVLAGLFLAALVAAAAPVERRGLRKLPPTTHKAGIALAGTVLTAAGFAGLAAGGFAHPFDAGGRAILGIHLSPGVSLVLLLLGAALTDPRRRRLSSGRSDDWSASPAASASKGGELRHQRRQAHGDVEGLGNDDVDRPRGRQPVQVSDQQHRCVEREQDR